MKFNVVGFLIFSLLLSFDSAYAQCVSTTDCDGYGIGNTIDLDDDNDGILDSNEG